jgi:hypothetical protein
MPGRNFPGCVIQGDSLSILLSSAEVVLDLAKQAGHEELIEEATDLVGSLAGRLAHYENVLKAHGIGLPYHRSNNT